jgi:hypothetical protein
MPKILVGAGILLILFDLAWLMGERFGLGGLPGDIVIERGNFRLSFPIVNALILVLWLFLH